MIELHPEILIKNGKKEFVILPYEEFVELQELLEGYQDLIELRKAKEAEGNEPTMSLEEVKRELDML